MPHTYTWGYRNTLSINILDVIFKLIYIHLTCDELLCLVAMSIDTLWKPIHYSRRCFHGISNPCPWSKQFGICNNCWSRWCTWKRVITYVRRPTQSSMNQVECGKYLSWYLSSRALRLLKRFQINAICDNQTLFSCTWFPQVFQFCKKKSTYLFSGYLWTVTDKQLC